MLAILYLAVVVAFGDALARRWFSYVSWPHRLATAFIIAMPLSAWVSYLGGLALSSLDDPLLPADAIAILVFGLATLWLRRAPGRSIADPIGRAGRWDWITLTFIVAIVGWMMLSTYTFVDGTLGIASGLWSDFGPTTAIAQSFAVGHNFPTEYPHFALEPIRYHFLFYFQVGNLTHLGLDPALATNVMSIGSMVSMLVLVMALGQRLFGSALVGRIGAVLFFFHGALSFIPFLLTFPSPEEALARLPKMEGFVASGFPYRGEEWGIWTQMVFLNQRHLAGAIAIILVIVLFLLERLGPDAGLTERDPEAPRRSIRERLEIRRAGAVKRLGRTAGRPVVVVRETLADPSLPGYVLCGLLAGMLPIWNGAIFVAAAAVLGVWFVVFPRRPQMLALALTTGLIALPQILFIRPDSGGGVSFPTFHWGYIIENATLPAAGLFLAFIFGPKLLLAAIGLDRATSRQFRVLLAFTSLVAVAFFVQLSVELLANHKFLNTWLIVLNLFAAAGLMRLWRLRPNRLPTIRYPARIVAAGLAVVILAGGLIDFIPVRNQGSLKFPLDGDRLYDWVRQETGPKDVFLTNWNVSSPILLAGRSLYFGWPYYAWSAGYDTGTREREYRDLFVMRSPRELVRRLQVDRIAYVVIDDELRGRSDLQDLNEPVYRANLEVAFDDPDNKYGHMVIFRVPTDPAAWASLPGAPAVDMYTGGGGRDAGRFDKPRGIAVASDGTVLVADTDNNRIQRFAADGTFLSEFGERGDGPGQFNGPSGVGADGLGHVFVADWQHHQLQVFDADGTFREAWSGPEPGFYGPRDVAVGPDDAVYVLDQGRARVVRRAVDGLVTTYGSLGAGNGELDDPTGVAIVGEFVVVADPKHGRIVVYRLDATFVRSIPVPEWGGPFEFPDVLGSADGATLFASSPSTHEVIVYDFVSGERTGSLQSPGPDELAAPSALAPGPDGDLLVIDYASNRVVRLAVPRR